jgi:hypothetical protein
MTSYSPIEFDADIIATPTGLEITITRSPLAAIPPVTIQQEFGYIPDLENGGQISVGQILSEHPNWNFYSQDPDTGYCQEKYTATWDGYKKARLFTGTISALWKPKIGEKYFIPFNKFFFSAEEIQGYLESLPEGTPPYEGSFGAGIVTDGLTHNIGLVFNGVPDATGKPIVVKKSVKVPQAAYSIPTGCNPPYTPTTTTPTTTTTKKKGRGN